MREVQEMLARQSFPVSKVEIFVKMLIIFSNIRFVVDLFILWIHCNHCSWVIFNCMGLALNYWGFDRYCNPQISQGLEIFSALSRTYNSLPRCLYKSPGIYVAQNKLWTPNFQILAKLTLHIKFAKLTQHCIVSRALKYNVEIHLYKVPHPGHLI